MAHFDSSFNFFIDIRIKDFDWFDNPYITPRVYEFNKNEIKLSKDVKLKVCDME